MPGSSPTQQTGAHSARASLNPTPKVLQDLVE